METETLPPQFARVPRNIARQAAEAAAVLNARGGSLLAGDLIREAMAAGLPTVLARRGVELVTADDDDAVREGMRKALDFARPMLAKGRPRSEVCEALNAAGLLNTGRRTSRPWFPDALGRALKRAQ